MKRFKMLVVGPKKVGEIVVRAKNSKEAAGKIIEKLEGGKVTLKKVKTTYIMEVRDTKIIR